MSNLYEKNIAALKIALKNFKACDTFLPENDDQKIQNQNNLNKYLNEIERLYNSFKNLEPDHLSTLGMLYKELEGLNVKKDSLKDSNTKLLDSTKLTINKKLIENDVDFAKNLFIKLGENFDNINNDLNDIKERYGFKNEINSEDFLNIISVAIDGDKDNKISLNDLKSKLDNVFIEPQYIHKESNVSICKLLTVAESSFNNLQETDITPEKFTNLAIFVQQIKNKSSQVGYKGNSDKITSIKNITKNSEAIIDSKRHRMGLSERENAVIDNRKGTELSILNNTMVNLLEELDATTKNKKASKQGGLIKYKVYKAGIEISVYNEIYNKINTDNPTLDELNFAAVLNMLKNVHKDAIFRFGVDKNREKYIEGLKNIDNGIAKSKLEDLFSKVYNEVPFSNEDQDSLNIIKEYIDSSVTICNEEELKSIAKIERDYMLLTVISSNEISKCPDNPFDTVSKHTAVTTVEGLLNSVLTPENGPVSKISMFGPNKQDLLTELNGMFSVGTNVNFQKAIKETFENKDQDNFYTKMKTLLETNPNIPEIAKYIDFIELIAADNKADILTYKETGADVENKELFDRVTNQTSFKNDIDFFSFNLDALKKDSLKDSDLKNIENMFKNYNDYFESISKLGYMPIETKSDLKNRLQELEIDINKHSEFTISINSKKLSNNVTRYNDSSESWAEEALLKLERSGKIAEETPEKNPEVDQELNQDISPSR